MLLTKAVMIPVYPTRGKHSIKRKARGPESKRPRLISQLKLKNALQQFEACEHSFLNINTKAFIGNVEIQKIQINGPQCDTLQITYIYFIYFHLVPPWKDPL